MDGWWMDGRDVRCIGAVKRVLRCGGSGVGMMHARIYL